jgi:5-formyltetrahydrofolate cyclo-ligase
LREDCERIGFCYDEQLLEFVPVAEHDEHMHVIVTPSRVFRLHSAPG